MAGETLFTIDVLFCAGRRTGYLYLLFWCVG